MIWFCNDKKINVRIFFACIKTKTICKENGFYKRNITKYPLSLTDFFEFEKMLFHYLGLDSSLLHKKKKELWFYCSSFESYSSSVVRSLHFFLSSALYSLQIDLLISHALASKRIFEKSLQLVSNTSHAILG